MTTSRFPNRSPDHALGTRFFAATKTRGQPAEMTIEITGYDPPRSYAQITYLASMDIDGTVTFETVPEGTRMRWSWQVHPRGLYKLMDPLIARMGRRQEEKIWAGLKEFLEARLPASGA